MRARDLSEALELQNATPYGLTGGISSLDEREIACWREAVDVGNAYVNRHITGAIVRRQPFGGWKRSAVGPGAKAGGPNYVASLGRWSWREPSALRSALLSELTAERERAKAEAAHLVPGVDDAGLRAERNAFRLRPLRRAVLRLGGPIEPSAPSAPSAHGAPHGMSLGERLVVSLAVSLGVASDLGVALDVSVDPARGDEVTAALGDAASRAQVHVEPRLETIEGLLVRLEVEPVDRVRLVDTDPAERLALLDARSEVDAEPLVALGTYELLRWTREQVVSATAHRHGDVIAGRRDA
jgi:RHH-type proline utilization regulon transcriptional repressor/proline dehydrogenase/delta 1-pyrroline-5-carboxylate dehydrogenase